MKPKIAGEQVQVGEVFRELLPRYLSERDKVAFHSHVIEIEKMKEANYPWGEWCPRKQIVENFCKRTGVNMRLLLKYVNGKFWMHIYKHLIDAKRI